MPGKPRASTSRSSRAVTGIPQTAVGVSPAGLTGASFAPINAATLFSFCSARESREPGYGLLNATIGLTLADRGFEFMLWGPNLAKKKYNFYILDFYAAAGVATGFPGQARTYGASAAYRF